MEIAAREMWVRRKGDPERTPLRLVLHAPIKVEEAMYETRASLTCEYFAEEFRVYGIDGLQSLMSVPVVLHGCLSGLEEHGPYEIGQFEPGDFHDIGFWGSPVGMLYWERQRFIAEAAARTSRGE